MCKFWFKSALTLLFGWLVKCFPKWYDMTPPPTTEQIDAREKAWMQAKSYLVGTGHCYTQQLTSTNQATSDFCPNWSICSKNVQHFPQHRPTHKTMYGHGRKIFNPVFSTYSLTAKILNGFTHYLVQCLQPAGCLPFVQTILVIPRVLGLRLQTRVSYTMDKSIFEAVLIAK